MNLLPILTSTLYYLSAPFTTVFWWTVACLAPFLHLGNYALSGFLLPLRLFAKFETLYIFLGAAAIVGLITGSVLHISSSVLVSVFNLTPIPEDTGRTAASVRAARRKKRQEQALQNSTTKSESANSRDEASIEKYAEWLEKSEQGLLGQTILEEDDSDGF
ncbi:hypothetical protein PZA11_002753 [Diplocarpon coronariae]|uniref:Uncharacterized protein n=1 Tax=Diplocarpon coronariae TaxID=2795749 RepID=A0A218YVU3_9HELO|nr:hypothetical protein JHW43_008326 [Diplocarpon mali]OWO99890.1 hypothetical protein B2J93_6945 [Marssonina coronariae]